MYHEAIKEVLKKTPNDKLSFYQKPIWLSCVRDYIRHFYQPERDA